MQGVMRRSVPAIGFIRVVIERWCGEQGVEPTMVLIRHLMNHKVSFKAYRFEGKLGSGAKPDAHNGRKSVRLFA
jgi:hypothetical protein